MIRFVGKEVTSIVRNAVAPRNAVVMLQPIRTLYDGAKDTEEGFNAKYVAYFNRADIDHWEIRQAMNQIAGMDLIPDPSILCAAFRACRRLNDFALTVRILEMVKDKCGPKLNEIYPYILQEIRPTLDELGINTPEELGYDKPELALQSVYDIH